jgi:hypothetical protein
MYNLNMLAHFRAIREYCSLSALYAELAASDLKMKISGNGRAIELVPVFLRYDADQVSLFRLPPPGSFHFAGWFYGESKRWPLAQDKRAFKDFCLQNGIPTPPVFKQGDEVDGAVVVKAIKSSQAQHCAGPYAQSVLAQLSLNSDFLIEKFVPGKMLRAWFWNGVLACVDSRTMPVLEGDGIRTAEELLAAQGLDRNPARKEIAMHCLHCQDVRGGDVLPSGRSVFIDYRYWSPANGYPMANQNVTAILPLALLDQLSQAGKSLWIGSPAEFKANSLFTLTAVLDDFGTAWVVDLEDTPLMHPDAYELVLSGLFGTSRTAHVVPRSRPHMN